jgi:hypothetical protein
MPSSQYDVFLFVEVGEQENGMTMSMASALIRLGLDPWDEAARLATLPNAPRNSRPIGLDAKSHLRKAAFRPGAE